MRDSLEHRGPDEHGLWISPDHSVGLGNRRLKIIDLVAGQQPMASVDGSVVISYNGELYNHAALRSQLERDGRQFRTRCDTEVVLAAYEQFGDRCLDQFDGMFAFALWDTRRRRLFFARDRVGEKPFYYAATQTGWVFGSEIKALLCHPQIERSVDTEALDHYLSFLTTPPPATMFAGVSKLPAAHCGSWSENDGLRTWRWWALPEREPESALTEDEAVDELRKRFEESVKERMMSEVPIGVYLSGGVDSSANVAFMARNSAEHLRTFSVAFSDEPSLNELAQARAVSDHFGTEHHELLLNDDDVKSCLPALIHHQDEPIADPVCVPLFHLAQLTKRSGVTVVQIGEGSDESFFGYATYAQAFRAGRAIRLAERVLPRRVLRSGVLAARPFIAEHRTELLQEALTRGLPPPHGISGLSERQKNRLLIKRTDGTSFEHLAGLFGSARSHDDIASVGLAHEFGLRMPELLLMRIDKMTMAASVEARAPFLDLQLIEFAARLPLGLHWSDGSGKLLLKRAFRGIVPEFVLSRRKQGFGAPVWRWLSSLREIAAPSLLREPLYEYLEPAGVRQLLDSPETTRNGFAFWVILNFALWHRHWIEGDDLRESAAFGVSRSRAQSRIASIDS
jgi:asparagine synthase (glutamine-hydrolysing)